MHLTDEQLASVAAGIEAVRRDEEAHVASCAQCAERVEAYRRDHELVAELLRAIDHTPPNADASRIIVAARRQRWRAVRPIAAGIALCVAAAAAAMPGSPVHRAIVRAMTAFRHPVRAEPLVSLDTVRERTGTGIAIEPGSELEVEFRGWQSNGQLLISIADAPQLTLVPRGGGDAAFAVSSGHVAIDNRKSTSSYALEIPRTAPSVRVRVDTVVVFEKAASHVTSMTPRDSAGVYLVDLTRPRTP